VRDDLPSGTVTFLFTDVEGSTRLLDELGDKAYTEALAEHRRLIRSACVSHGGVEVDTQGDAFFFAFPTAPSALGAAGEATEGLASGLVHVRIGLHTGTPFLTEEGYVGQDVHRAARIAAAAHGGQVVLSQKTRSLLGDGASLRDLGEHRFKDLAAPERVYQLGDGDFPPLKSIYRTNLPIPASSFLGRDRELGELVELVAREDVRLLTLTGPGGTGKTRLALQAAAEAADIFPDGLWWVSLAPLRDPGLALSAVAQALEVKEESGRELVDLLVERLGGKRALVLLDNAEHLLPDLARELSPLVRDTGTTAWLMTSRERLQLTGEHVYPVPTLERDMALELFLERAGAVGSSLAASDAARELCARLDDLPLALELAAARTVLFSPEQLLERLSQRLDLLKGGRDVDPRQRTLRATIEWSYDLLDPQEQRVFRSLSVFAGGCTYEAAEEICEADPDTLQSLLDKSLLRRRESELGPRYWLLETIREYAGERLLESDEAEKLPSRHAEFFLALAENLEPSPLGGLEEGALRELHAEIDNLRMAIHVFSQTTEPVGELRLIGSLFRFWELVGLVTEGRRMTEHALERSKNADRRLRLKVLYSAFHCAFHQANWDDARKYEEERLALARQVGDMQVAGVALMDLGILAMEAGDFRAADSLYDESAGLAREIGDEVTLLAVTVNRGDLALTQGDFLLARGLLEEALAHTSRLAETHGRVRVLASLGHVFLGLREPRLAAGRYREGLELSLRFAGPVETSVCVEGLSAVAIADGDAVRAARLSSIADSLRTTGGFNPLPFERELNERTDRAARAALGDEAWESERARGAAMSLEEAVAYALGSSD
jgi:predicted ATPase/class 3 adenylate cyclase